MFWDTGSEWPLLRVEHFFFFFSPSGNSVRWTLRFLYWTLQWVPGFVLHIHSWIAMLQIYFNILGPNVEIWPKSTSFFFFFLLIYMCRSVVFAQNTSSKRSVNKFVGKFFAAVTTSQIGQRYVEVMSVNDIKDVSKGAMWLLELKWLVIWLVINRKLFFYSVDHELIFKQNCQKYVDFLAKQEMKT